MEDLKELEQFDSEGRLTTSFNKTRDELLARKERSDEIRAERVKKIEGLKKIIVQSEKAIVAHEEEIAKKDARLAGIEGLFRDLDEALELINADVLRIAEEGLPETGTDEFDNRLAESKSVRGQWDYAVLEITSKLYGRGKK